MSIYINDGRVLGRSKAECDFCNIFNPQETVNPENEASNLNDESSFNEDFVQGLMAAFFLKNISEEASDFIVKVFHNFVRRSQEMVRAKIEKEFPNCPKFLIEVVAYQNPFGRLKNYVSKVMPM